MNLDNIKELTKWALWASQWKGAMRSSDVLRPSDDKARPLNPSKDTPVRRVTWERVDPDANDGCKTRLRWRLKPKKTGPGG